MRSEPDFSPVWSYEGRVPLTFHYLTLKSTQATISSPSGYQPGAYLLIITDGFQNFPVQVTIPGIPIGPAPAPSCGGGVIIFSHSRSTSQQKAALPFDPCSTPAPTPVAEIAYDWNNDGELGTDDNGLVSINQGPPVVGYEPGGTITSAAQSASVPQSYKQQAEVLQTQALPLGYTPAPPYLNISPIAYARINTSLFRSLFTQNGGCSAAAEDQRGDPSDHVNARNPLYYQTLIFCIKGVSPSNFKSTWGGTSFNEPMNERVATIQEALSPAPSNPIVPEATVYATVPRIAYLVNGHAENNRPRSIQFDLITSGKFFTIRLFSSHGPGRKIALNNRGVPYPIVKVELPWGPTNDGGYVPKPRNPPYLPVAGTGNDDNKALRRALKVAEFPKPAAGFQAHHIKPQSWGGTDDAINGVWLPTTAAGFPNLHSPFTIWFDPRNFSP